jgi:hypothetical protein
MRRITLLSLSTTIVLMVFAAPALACGGLIGPRGSVNLLRTTTLAGYANGIEHYVTSFEFAGAGGAFGSIVPLPGVPTDVVKGGNWTLQRLVRETQPQPEFVALAAATRADATPAAKVLLEKRIDALDITILEGGGDEVGVWAKQNGFKLPPDAPEVLDFYGDRSPIFMAARFDAAAAEEKGAQLGDGTPIHLTIPTAAPWVPLRILGLGREDAETVQADVYLLTESEPRLLPGPQKGLDLRRSESASIPLLDDLRSDEGMSWVPQKMWLSYLKVDAAAKDLKYDLAVSVTGGAPSRVAAGLPKLPEIRIPASDLNLWPAFGVLILLLVASTAVIVGIARTT